MESQEQNRKDLLLIFLIIAIGAIGAFVLWFMYGDQLMEGSVPLVDGGTCNVMALDVHGCIVTYAPDPNFYVSEDCDAYAASESIYQQLVSAQDDDSIKAVILDIDSGGGMPQAALEVETGIKELEKPSVALIRAYGQSAAYWIASAADIVVASEESDVGGIGVTMSYVDYAAQNADSGVTYNSISAGKFKDMGDPNKPLTVDERTQLQASVATTYENFIRTIAENRDLSLEKVRALADGSSLLGAAALENGLIDRLGSFKAAEEELEELIGEKPVFCWPQYYE